MSQNIDIKELNARIERHSAFVDTVVMGMNRNIVEQKHYEIGRASCRERV